MTPDAPIDQFTLDDRLCRAGVPLAMDGPLSKSQADQIIDAVKAYLHTHDLSQEQLARAADIPNSYVSRLLSRGIFPASSRDKYLRTLNTWIDEDARSRATRRPANFVLIKPCERLVKLARNLRRRRAMGIAWGPAGIGKTLTPKTIEADLPGTILLRVTRDSRTEAKLLRALHHKICRSGTVSLQAIVDRLRDTGRLLILDQAHELKANCFKLLMDLHDEAELPILLIGTVDLHKFVAADGQASDFGQVYRRFAFRIDLLPEMFIPVPGGGFKEWITVDQLRSMFERGRIKLHPAVAKELRDMANNAVGHLGIVANLVRNAELLGGAGDGPILVTPELLAKAIEMGEGQRPRAIPVGQVLNLPVPQEVNA